jgi:opacity protein-like surface antigen
MWALVAATLVALPAAAVEPPAADETYGRPGWYLGLGGVYAFEDLDGDAAQLGLPNPPYPSSFEPNFDDSAGINLRGGYRLAPHFAVELEYEWLEGFDDKGARPQLEVDSHLVLLDAKVFALTGRLQPYAKAGVGVHITNLEIVDDAYDKPWEGSTGFAARFGIGVDYYLTPHWLLELEGNYLVGTGDAKYFDYGGLMLGAQYRF